MRGRREGPGRSARRGEGRGGRLGTLVPAGSRALVGFSRRGARPETGSPARVGCGGGRGPAGSAGTRGAHSQPRRPAGTRVVGSVQSLSRARLFATPWAAARQDSLSSTSSRSLLRLVSVESVTPSNRLILCLPFSSCLQLLPASGSFQMSQFFASDGQSIGVSASTSVLPVTVQH